MVATLVLALPTRSAGGRLVMRHRDEEARFDLGGDDPSETGFAAFYADCLHEAPPVADGHRLVLAWNLIRDDAGAESSGPDHAAETEALARHLAGWPDDAPSKIAIPLEHAYTPERSVCRGSRASTAPAPRRWRRRRGAPAWRSARRS